jgi:hypothetical protein
MGGLIDRRRVPGEVASDQWLGVYISESGSERFIRE